jgi:hypothetical protein
VAIEAAACCESLTKYIADFPDAKLTNLINEVHACEKICHKFQNAFFALSLSAGTKGARRDYSKSASNRGFELFENALC